MTTTKRGLGRGLSALIPDNDMEFLTAVARSTIPATPIKSTTSVMPSAASQSAKISGKNTSPRNRAATIDRQNEEVEQNQEILTAQNAKKPLEVVAPESVGAQFIALNAISPNPYQPRRTFSEEEMQELVDSIRTHGLLQPILVRPVLDGGKNAPGYQLVAGERRWRAAQKAGLNEVPAIVRDVNNQQSLELAIIENVQRHDISAMDAAIAYQRLASEFGLPQEKIAQRVGKSRSAIANTLRLLDLPPEIQKAIEDGTLSEGHGRAILLTRGEGARRAVFRRVLRDKLSVRDTERLAQSSTSNEAGEVEKQKTGKTKDVEVQQVEALLQKKLGVRARVAPRRKGGTILLPYTSNEELQRILEFIDR